LRKTTSFLLDDAIRAREDRNAYFRAGLDYLQENSIPGVIGRRKYRFHWNINLYIDMHAKCNGRCKFCINRVKFSREDVPDDRYLGNLETTLQRIRFLNPTIQIVGGEPTLRPKRLFAIVDLINKYRIRKPVIGTNGSGIGDKTLLDYVEPVIDHLNISRHHNNHTRLISLMGFNNPLDNPTLSHIMREHPISRKIRLNCCLLRDNVDSHEKILTYIDWAMELGVRNICFSTLSQLSEDYMYQKGLVDHSRLYRIDFNAIMNAISADPRFTFEKFHTGSHCMYEVWEYNRNGRSVHIVFATSNNLFAQALDQIDDLIELLVFHCDGTLAGSWNKDCKILLN
jgi:GTP 3',8-cyclase